MNSTNPSNPNNLGFRLSIVVIIAILAGFFLYRSSVESVISAVIHRDGSSHGVFVPFLSLFFIWIKRDALKRIQPEINFWGLFFIILGIFPLIFNIDSPQLRFIGYIFSLSGMVLTVLGPEIFRATAFPLFFLITMTPLPKELYEPLANYSRHIAFGGALKIISLLGIPYIREGWVIQLPNAVLKVGESCSGIRYLISYIVFGLAYTYMFKTTIKGKLFTILLIIPISHFASICRLTVIFVLTYTFGPQMAEYWPHVFISWVIFGIILFMCIASDQHGKNKRDPNRSTATDKSASFSSVRKRANRPI